MFIYPDFLKEFHCIGGDCLNTCCAGWFVKLDEDIADYYEHLDGTFGDFLHQHVIRDEKTNKITAIQTDENNRCPFLNEEGLCRIQIEYGPEHLGSICQNFPRHEHGSGDISLLGVVSSCDAILDILYNRTQPVYLCTAGENQTNISTEDEYACLELAHFISWGMDLLQDESVPFGTALATVLLVGLETENPFQQKDFKTFDTLILQAPEIQAQFMQAKQDLNPDELDTAAWRLILGVTAAFCQTLSETPNAYHAQEILWKHDMFRCTDAERKCSIFADWQKCRNDKRHTSFIRRLAAVSFLHHALQNPASVYFPNICITMILAEILPLTWEDEKDLDERVYLSRLSLLTRWFEQDNPLNSSLQTLLKNLYAPDLYTYATALMVLFDS